MTEQQMSLLADTPAARATDPDSSHQAAEHVTQSGVRASQQHEVVRLVRMYPGHTSAELARKSGRMDRWQIARRLPECAPVHVGRGKMRTCTVTGRRSLTWWPAAGEAAA